MLSVWQGVAAVDWFVHKRNEYYCATNKDRKKDLGFKCFHNWKKYTAYPDH